MTNVPHRRIRLPGLLLSGLLALSSPLSAAIALGPWAHEIFQVQDDVWAHHRFSKEDAGTLKIVNDAPKLSPSFLRDDESYESQAFAAFFDGASAHAILPGTGEGSGLQGLTVAAWIKPDFTRPRKLEESGYLVSKNRGAHEGFSLMISYKDGLSASLVTTQGRYHVNASHVLKKGEWQLVGFTWDGTRLTLLHNGQPVGEAVETEGSYRDYARPITIGKAADRDGLYYRGAISEVLILRKAVPIPENRDEVSVTQPASQSPLQPGVTRRPRSLLPGMKAPDSLVDFQNLEGWKVTYAPAATEAKLERVRERALWGDFSAKLSFRNGSLADPSKRKIVIEPPQPIPIPASFDAVRLRLFGTFWGKQTGVTLSVQWRNPNGEVQDESLQSGEYPFVFWRGWSILNKTLSARAEAPAELLSLTVEGFDAPEWQYLYLGPLSVHTLSTDPLPGSFPTWKELGVDATPAAIVPPVKDAKSSVSQEGPGYRFSVNDHDGTSIAYRYLPETGQLSDLTLLLPDQRIKVAEKGGWELELDGESYPPDDPRVTRRLLSCELRDAWIHSDWEWSVKGAKEGKERTFRVSWRIGIVGRSLVVESESEAGLMRAMRFGAVAGAREPQAVKVPYLVLRGRLEKSVDPSILITGNWFISGLIDWTASRASELFGAEGGEGEAVVINGGSAYFPKTNGQRNAPAERLVFSASQRFADVLPRIPNPPNRWRDMTKERIWSTRMWYPTENQLSDYFDRELAYWKKMHAYGARDISVRLHNNIYRTYLDYSGEPFALTSRVDPSIGGDEGLARFSREMREGLGFRLGIITNYTVISPNAFDVWDENFLSLAPDGNWRYGSGNNHALKPTRALETLRRYTGELKEKYGFNIGYTDQITCRPPWALVDYDARVPGAGEFGPVVRTYARALLLESEILDAPVFSEGIMHWMYAGFSDSYSQPGNYQETNFLVDFQHYRINPLSNDCGSSIATLTRRGDCYHLIASQLAYGNIGHLADNYSGVPPGQGPSSATLKSYFLMRFIQPLYANEPIQSIRYHHGGKLLTTEEAIRTHAFKDQQVALRYENGTVVWVNRSPDREWLITDNGRQLRLPGNGFHARSQDGATQSSSMLESGRRVDFAAAPGRWYADASGKPYNFGLISAGEAYVIMKPDVRTTELIPAPFRMAETVTLRGESLPVQSGKVRIEHLSEDGVIGRTEEAEIRQGQLSIQTQKQSFKYRITAL